MENVTKVHCIRLPHDATSSNAQRFYYTQDGIAKHWDLLQRDSALHVIIFDTNKKCLIAFKKFKPETYMSYIPYCLLNGEIDLNKYPLRLGISFDLCSCNPKEATALTATAIALVLKKCGYNVKQENMHEIQHYRAGIGLSSAEITMFYCEVTDSDKTDSGCPSHDDAIGFIELIEVTIPQIKAMLCSHKTLVCSSDFLYAIQWLLYKYEHKELHNFKN